MTAARKFLFDTDFRDPAGDAKHQASLQDAERRGYAQGYEAGRLQAQGDAQARLADALQRVGDGVVMLVADLDARQEAAEAQAMDFAVALARKLAGEALRRQPLAPIAEAALAAFQLLRGVPHLVVRVHESLVEAVEPLIQRIARERGFEGRLVILGEPDLAPGDVRLEWADGGVVREQAAIEATVDLILSSAFPASKSLKR